MYFYKVGRIQIHRCKERDSGMPAHRNHAKLQLNLLALLPASAGAA